MKESDRNFLTIFILIVVITIPFSLRLSFLFKSNFIGTIVLCAIYLLFGFLYYTKYSKFKEKLSLKETVNIYLRLFLTFLIGIVGLFIFLSFSDVINGRIILLGGSILLGLLTGGFFLSVVVHYLFFMISGR